MIKTTVITVYKRSYTHTRVCVQTGGTAKTLYYYYYNDDNTCTAAKNNYCWQHNMCTESAINYERRALLERPLCYPVSCPKRLKRWFFFSCNLCNIIVSKRHQWRKTADDNVKNACFDRSIPGLVSSEFLRVFPQYKMSITWKRGSVENWAL